VAVGKGAVMSSRLFIAAAAVAVAVCVSAAARADFKTGDQLYTACTSSTPPEARVYCRGYVASATDAARAGNNGQKVNDSNILGFEHCGPNDLTLRQDIDIVIAFLEAHPKLRHLGAAGLVARALSEAYPCR
jgi:hypothetical protein